jgi:hypothetical protein
MNLPTEIILFVMLGWGSFELFKSLRNSRKSSPENTQYLQEENIAIAINSAVDAITESPAVSRSAETIAEDITTTIIHAVEAIGHSR